jgi:hypothetical protein
LTEIVIKLVYMSLSSLLETDAELRAYLRDLVAMPGLPRPAPTLLAPPRSRNSGLVGTAFDYLLRWDLEWANPHADVRPWVAEEALPLVPQAQRSLAAAVVTRAKEQHAAFLQRRNFSEEVLAAALGLARLDTVFRSGVGVCEIGKPPEIADAEDLRGLVAAVPDEFVRRYDSCVLNPTFGRASLAIGGADADLILDDTLIDVKTTKHFKLERIAFDQLIGYVLLARLGGVNGNHTRGRAVQRIGIYYARYGRLVAWPIGSLLTETRLRNAENWLRGHLATLPPISHA